MATRSKIIISGKNYVDDASSISADDEVVALPVENLQDRQITKVFRNTQLTAQIDVDFGSARLTDFAAIIAHNLTTAATIRWRLSAVSDFATTVYDSGTINAWEPTEGFGASPWGVFNWGGLPSADDISLYTASTFTVLDNPVLARYLRVDLSDSANGDGYLQAGRLMSGQSYQPTVNYANGVQFQFVDESRVTKSRGGQTFIDTVQKYRTITFDLNHLPQDEAFGSIFNNLDRLKGISGDVLVIPQPDEPSTYLTQNIYGRISAIGPIRNTTLDFYSRTMEIEELI